MKLKATQRCRVRGQSYNPGDDIECSDEDARVLVAMKQAEYAKDDDAKDAAKQKGLNTKTAGAVVKKNRQ